MDQIFAGIAAAWHAFCIFMEYVMFFGIIIVIAIVRKWLGLGNREDHSSSWDNPNVWGAHDSNSRDVYHYPGPGGSPEEELRMLRAGRGRNSL